ncbi:MAG: hypothetical protein IPH48_18255 [bacterium]|nr:hypothetical protein [bacterium]
MEQALLTDQDTALVYARDEAGARSISPAWPRVVGDLVTAGFRPVPAAA